MIRHDGIGTEVNGEEIRQQFHAIDDPLASMPIAFAAMGVHTAEIGAAYAARDAVVIVP